MTNDLLLLFIKLVKLNLFSGISVGWYNTFIGICGMIHHYYIDNNYLLCLDLIAISIGFIAYTYYSKIDKNIYVMSVNAN